MCKILTIAIPAYNMEKYVGHCLDSVLHTDTANTIEVLLINDGSKDSTLRIAQEYAKKWPETLRVINKPNGGWGSAINCAISEATGKYFKILDADDWFDTQALIDFIRLLQRTDVDLAASSYTLVYENGKQEEYIYPTHQCNRVIPFSQYIKEQGFSHNLCLASITFRTEILQKNKIKVADRYYADIDFGMSPLLYVKNICLTQTNLYKYYKGREGQSTSIAGYNAHLQDFIDMGSKLIKNYAAQKDSMSPEIRNMYLKDYTNIARFSYYLLMSPMYGGKHNNSSDKLKDFDTFLKQTSPELYTITAKIRIKRIIPYIQIWRKTGINILKLRTWI